MLIVVREEVDLTVHQRSGFELAYKQLFSGLDVPQG